MKISEMAIKALRAPSLKEFMISLLPGQKSRSISTLSSTGISVTEESALTIVAYWACVRLLSETFASLPCILYRRLARGKERATDRSLYRILHDQPNPEMNAFTFWELMKSHIVTWGDAFAQIIWEDNTTVRALYPMLPDRTDVRRDTETRQVVYDYYPNDGRPKVTLPAYRVLHVPGLGYDGLRGYSPVSMARQALGLAKATEQCGAKLFANGILATGVLTYPHSLSDISRKNLKKSFKDEVASVENAGDPMILEEGMKWQQLTIPPDDAQFLETRKFQRGEIASFFHVPPHMIGDLERATFSNIEHQSLEFVIYTMRPWLVRFEKAINTKLLNPGEQQDYFVEFLIDGLLRGDLESRYRAYAIGRNWGWLSANDVCELENRNPIGPEGDVYMAPANMLPADQFEAQVPKPAGQFSLSPKRLTIA